FNLPYFGQTYRSAWVSVDTVNEFIAGAIGGMAGLAVGHPMDTVKILMQNSLHRPTTMGVVNLVRQAGLTNFFKGLSLPFYSYGIVNAVTFGTYKCSLKKLDPTEASSGACAVAGALSAVVQLIPAVPVELIKIQQQNSASRSGPAPSILNCIRAIIQTHGFRGLYTGLTAHAFRDVPGLTVYFLTYGKILSLNTCFGLSPFWSAFIAGAISGPVSWVVSMPFDVVKTRMQSGELNTAKDVLRGLLKQNDYAVFFRGFHVTMLRALIVNASVFAVYEVAYDWLNKKYSSSVYVCDSVQAF
ncbi:solute carrier family 25, member 45/47, partial [Paragonimus westermani]